METRPSTTRIKHARMWFRGGFLRAALLCAVLVLTLLAGTGVAVAAFDDVPAGDPYAAAIEGMQAAEIINGYPPQGGKTLFKPNNPVWRGQFAKMIVGALALPIDETRSSPFTDLDPDNPGALDQTEYVAVAFEHKVTTGLTATSFGPYKNIRRAQVVTMIVRALQNEDVASLVTPPSGYVGTLGSFDTTHSPYMKIAEYNDLLDGVKGFGSAWDPYGDATRGDVAQMLWNVLDLAGGSLARTIPLGPGGSITIPAGALPGAAQIEAGLTQMPLLPDYVEAKGQALAISATGQPSQPVTLRLPVPAGVADPSDLTIIRVESDGTTTFLMTEVEGNELVAATPGFSTFAVGALLSGRELTLVGSDNLLVGAQEVFSVGVAIPENAYAATWTVSGQAVLVYDSGTAAIVQAGDRVGGATLAYECVDLADGRRWFGYRTLHVVENLDPRGAENGKFSVTVVTRTPISYAGSDVRLTAGVNGEFAGPITWTWDYGDGVLGGPVTTDTNTTHYELPAKRYPPEDKYAVYQVRVVAKDARGREAEDSLRLYVVEQPFSVALEGPQRVPWSDPAAYQAYTARASGGESPYVYDFELLPWKATGQGTGATSTKMIIFDEPGEYVLAVRATDVTGDPKRSATAALPIVVSGGERLSARILGLPASAEPGADVAADFQVRGGVLVVSGKKAGYDVRVDWGDGSAPLVEKNVGAARTPSEGTIVSLSHEYSKIGTYTVRIDASDSTGTSTYDSREITIGEAGTDPPSPPQNSAPAAEAVTTSTRIETSVPITLRGSDPDGDELTYVVVSGPAKGSLTGSAPFLTYTPGAGFSGTDSFTYKVNDGKADSPTATVKITVADLMWVREGGPVINSGGAPLEYYGGGSTPGYFTEPRFEGKFTVYSVSETSISVDDRDVDRGFEYYNVTINSFFDPPPAVLLPGESHDLTVRFSHSGTVAQGNPGAAFQYGADSGHGGIIGPSEALGYAPWSPSFGGVASKTWILKVPPGRKGDSFQIVAYWWNSPCGNVTWTYRAQ